MTSEPFAYENRLTHPYVPDELTDNKLLSFLNDFRLPLRNPRGVFRVHCSPETVWPVHVEYYYFMRRMRR